MVVAPSDYLLLRVDDEVQGFCRLTLADSERPIERFYPQRLPQPWGQYGPLGLSRAVRGQGLGGYLIDAAAVHMQSLGCGWLCHRLDFVGRVVRQVWVQSV